MYRRGSDSADSNLTPTGTRPLFSRWPWRYNPDESAAIEFPDMTRSMNSIRVLVCALVGIGAVCGGAAGEDAASGEFVQEHRSGAHFRLDPRPGAPPFDVGLTERLAQAFTAKGHDYVPRS
jgi:hypothetical protein